MIIRKIVTEAKPLIRIIKKEAEEVATSSMRIVPKAQAPKPKMTIKPKVAQTTFEGGVGANIVAEQNRALIASRPRTTHHMTIGQPSGGYTSPYHDDYLRLCGSGSVEITPEKALELQQKFLDETGLILHVPASRTSGFSIALDSICTAVHEGTFPKDIKHVLIGHGYGSSQAKTWALEGRGLKDGKPVEILPYISENIPKGEKVLVCSCESPVGKIAGKPGIGDEVILSLGDADAPGKVVRSGIDRIIGQYTITGGFVPYEMYIKPKA